MSVLIKYTKPGSLGTVFNVQVLWRLNSTSTDAVRKEDEEEFRVLDILKKKDKQKKKTARRTDIQPDRAERMSPDQVN